jgi:hypothetical protein
MKYMLLIHQGDAPTPRDPEAWSRLLELVASDAERRFLERRLAELER